MACVSHGCNVIKVCSATAGRQKRERQIGQISGRQNIYAPTLGIAEKGAGGNGSCSQKKRSGDDLFPIWLKCRYGRIRKTGKSPETGGVLVNSTVLVHSVLLVCGRQSRVWSVTTEFCASVYNTWVSISSLSLYTPCQIYI